MTTPFGWLAERVTLSPRALRWGTTAALIVSILIVLGGGVVRVTGSGLGCPTWPACNASEVIAPISDNIHQVIEQTNRLITVLLIVAVGWAIVAARLQRHPDRMLTRLAWSMFWLVVINAVAGGVTVLVQLNPWVVALHFVLAMALLATATLTWHRARWRGDLGARVGRGRRVVIWLFLLVAAVLVVVGTLVSGAGPHAGDSGDVPRIPVDWTALVWVHGGIATVLVLATVAFAIAVPRARRTALILLGVLLLQGAIGIVQSLTGLPSLLVGLHVLGAAFVWVGSIRVVLDASPGLFALKGIPAEVVAPL
jgi:cytochrome c oxidase assembly protein subunit 15